MNQSIHQSYRDILAEIYAESAARRNAGNESSNVNDIIYFPKAPQKVEAQSLYGKMLLIGFAALIVGTVCSAIAVRHKTEPTPQIAAVPEHRTAPVESSPSPRNVEVKLAKDIDLMKKILSSLVQSVQVLSEEKDRRDLEPRFPYPVRVISERAHLRAAPNPNGKSISVVSKDAILLATAKESGWLKVSTPKGTQAWISQDVVVAKEE